MSRRVKFFPFSPGVPWIVKNNIIVPKLHGDIWRSVLNDKDWVVVAYGGLIESIFSLCAIEALHKLNANKKIHWVGNDEYKFLVNLQGIAIVDNINLSENTVKNYPVPIFFDKNNNVYFNLLNNYIDVSTYFLEFIKKDKRPIFEQIFENLTIKWDYSYILKMRNMSFESSNFVEWSTLNKFYINKPYVVIIPELNKYSNHITSCLGWSTHDTRAFISLLNQNDISPVVVTKNINKYKISNREFFIHPDKLDVIVMLLSRSAAILSESIDFLLAALLLSDNIKLLSKSHFDWFNIEKNRNYIGADNECFINSKLNPINALSIIK